MTVNSGIITVSKACEIKYLQQLYTIQVSYAQQTVSDTYYPISAKNYVSTYSLHYNKTWERKKLSKTREI